MIQNLIENSLLRNVRTEIQENLSFTPKETDIYKIHQSGDLANLDGLDDASLKLLPSLLTLRDALYSSTFREYLSTIVHSGPLSGKKTDMAINVYTPGCHLLCHDDVIGSRRISYILYLTDPDRPWKKEWGGALRLYPTRKFTTDGKETKVPSPDYTVSIPPAFNQLSFFAVQPGESFHDVEEVYARKEGEAEDDGGRVRMAISGWYHIPQEGEEGYEKGLEEKLAEKSSLMQLQSKGDVHDLPQPEVHFYDSSNPEDSTNGDVKPADSTHDDDSSFTEADFDLLLRYMAPNYLTPDTVHALSSLFADQFSLRLDTFLSAKFATTLKEYVTAQEKLSLPASASEIETSTSWTVARPPHKHRFLYMQHSSDSTPDPETLSPLQDLLINLLPSSSFRKWLQLATDLSLTSHNLLARRFRRGKDYTLATGYDEESSRLEITLGITPTGGWGDDNDDDDDDSNELERSKGVINKDDKVAAAAVIKPEDGVGGYEVYMAGDDADCDSDADSKDPSSPHSNDGVAVPLDMSTAQKTKKSDPAVYRAAKGDAADEDDGVLFSMPAGWNRLSVVLRDQGVLRFVKYVGAGARGDRWDVVGEFGVADDGDGDGEGGEGRRDGDGNGEVGEKEGEEASSEEDGEKSEEEDSSEDD